MPQRDVTDPQVPDLYGGAGLFEPCTDPVLLNASVSSRGVLSWLRAMPSIYALNQTGVITDVGHKDGDADMPFEYVPPSAECGACETANFSICEYGWRFAEYCISAPVRKVNQIGVMPCLAQPKRRMFGEITDSMGRPIPGAGKGSLIDNQDEWDAVVAMARLARVLSTDVWGGDGALHNVLIPSLGYAFLGLATQINTGWLDKTGISCDGVDPDVKQFNDTVLTDRYNGYGICEYMTALVENAIWRAEAALGEVSPGEMAFFTTPNIAKGIVKEWECCDAQTCTTGDTNSRIVIDAYEFQRRRRANFQMGLWLAGIVNVNGMDIPVYGDPYIPFTRANGQETADVYLLTKSAGGMDTLFIEYQNYNEASSSLARKNGHVQITDGGKYLSLFEQTFDCYQTKVLVNPRVIVKAPFLQGRLVGVTSAALQLYPYPGETYSGRTAPAALSVSGGRNP